MHRSRYAVLTFLAQSANNLIIHARDACNGILESAAARCSLSAAEFRNRESIVLVANRHGKRYEGAFCC